MRKRPFFGAILAILIGLGAGCGGAGPAQPPAPATGRDSGQTAREPLPEVPTEVDAVRIDPTRGHDEAAKSPLLDLMLDENRRSMKWLNQPKGESAFFLAYTVTEERNVVIEAEGGGLLADIDDTERILDVEVRVGDPTFDNRRVIAGDRLAGFTFLQRPGRAPFGDEPEAIRRQLWLETDRRYREAVLVLRNLKTQERLLAESDKTADFSHEKKERFFQKIEDLDVEKERWRKQVRDCSKRARRGVATRSGCRLDATVRTTYYVNSEGSQIQLSRPTARFSVSVGIKARDGMPLSRTDEVYAPTPDMLPTGGAIERMIKNVAAELDALYKAPVVDPFVGPAILEGRAAAVFFHEVFGHRIEGHRQKDPNFGKTFTAEVGNRIMPSWLDVYDDSTIETLNGTPVNGFYRFDDEGVRAQRVSLVESGVLKGFVSGRTPLEGFPKSNGHGRRAPGLPAVSRQGNLVVEATRSVSKAELRQRLLAEVKRQGKPFGMVFTDISGGFTNTSNDPFAAQSFKVIPTMAYRLYPDGREELVRGVDIVGTPLTVLASILAAARPVEIFNGICGAESGWVPVSASAPSLLLEKMEIERSFKPSNSPPVLQPPASLEAIPRR